MMAWTISVIMQNFVEIERCASAWEDEVWCFSLFCLFIYNARTLNGHKWPTCVIQQEIASVFVGQFRWGLQLFFGEEKPFQVNWTDLKIVAMWHYDTYWNARDNFQNLRKWVRSLCAPLRSVTSELKESALLANVCAHRKHRRRCRVCWVCWSIPTCEVGYAKHTLLLDPSINIWSVYSQENQWNCCHQNVRF